ncbi:MAG: hypothetical protein NVSMB13_10650 [Mycobacteriales bacterium]
MSSDRARTWARLAVGLGLTAAVATGLGGTALAADSGGGNPPGYSTGTALLVFVAAPLALFIVISALALVGSGGRGGRRERYRPDRGWDREPVWVGGPDDPTGAIEGVTPASGTGGASGSW